MIRFILAIFFQDGVVFFDTGLDIFVNHSILYANTTLQSTFNYFPLAYLVTLPQIWLYYQLPFRNDVLLRLMFKFPKILADLFLAYLVSDKILTRFLHYNIISKDQNVSTTRFVNSFELFILFNPLNIYISAMTSQIDMFPAILLILCWYAYKNDKYLLSGIFVMSALLIKEYAIFVVIFMFFALIKNSYKDSMKFIGGNLLVLVPTIGIISIINFKGFLDHAILYQLFRQPIGSSLSAFIYELGMYILPKSFLPVFQSLISIMGFSIIAIVTLVGVVKVFNSPNDKNVILYAVLAFLTFCLFNKVFWPQYLVPLLALWILYRVEVSKEFSQEFINWTLIMTPVFLLYRSGEFATKTLVFLLGLDFFTDILITAVILHVLLLLLLYRYKKITLKNKKVILTYFVVILFIISQIYFQWYFIHLPSYTLQKMPK